MYWFLSFAEPEEGFLGAVIAEAPCAQAAIRTVTADGLNPGGCVVVARVPANVEHIFAPITMAFLSRQNLEFIRLLTKKFAGANRGLNQQVHGVCMACNEAHRTWCHHVNQ